MERQIARRISEAAARLRAVVIIVFVLLTDRGGVCGHGGDRSPRAQRRARRRFGPPWRRRRQAGLQHRRLVSDQFSGDIQADGPGSDARGL